jgi:hypothetical protein
MMFLSTVSVGASTKFAIVSENNTLGIENSAPTSSLTATHISKVVFTVICPFL